jgi:hypothetical protein|nr:MAG TPA: hypothetical protein [Caudoviricetes sp.]
MYINPFVAGVLATIIVEVVAIIIAAIISGNKEDK